MYDLYELHVKKKFFWRVGGGGGKGKMSSNNSLLISPIQQLDSTMDAYMQCPHIDSSRTDPIYLPVDSQREILLRTLNIPTEHPDIPHTFQCVLDTGTDKIIAPAIPAGERSLFCDIPKVKLDELLTMRINTCHIHTSE